MVLGALIIPLLLPLLDLRNKANQRLVQKQFNRSTVLKIAVAGAFFLPNIIVRFLGPQAWLDSLFISAFIAVTTGAMSALMFGCVFSMTGKFRVFWVTLAFSFSQFVYNLVLGPARELLLPYTFPAAGFALSAMVVLLLVFLAALTSRNNLNVEEQLHESNSMIATQLGGGGGNMAVSYSCRFARFMD
jgi:hypothetical protein